MIGPQTHNPIGIDLGARVLKAVQLGRNGKPAATLVLPRRSDAPEALPDEIQRLAAVLHRHGFTGRSVVAACPHDRLMMEPIGLPPAGSGAPLNELASAELARTRQLEPGSFEVGFWPIPTPARGGDGAFVMTAATRHVDADALLEPFDLAGLDLMAIDAPACALARGAADDIAGQRGMAVLIDLGWDAARVVVVLGGVIVFERGNAEGGLKHLFQQCEQTLELDPEAIGLLIQRGGIAPVSGNEGDDDPAWLAVRREAQGLCAGHFDHVVRELGMAVNYIGHRYPESPAQRAVLTGGGAALPGVKDYLQAALGVDAVLPDETRPGDSLLRTAQGLARHGGEAKGVAA